MARTTVQKPQAAQNGKPDEQTLSEAIAYEEGIAAEAAEIRQEAVELTPALFMQLRPLLRRSIPPALTKYVPKLEKGKPYESTGVKSVQVQIDRLDNVLTPMWWHERIEYADDGKLCHVTVTVGSVDGAVLFSRESRGGVDRGSTTGNVWKGSYTNAAKLAFARVGPGWEIYIGAADFDPDTDEDAAKAQGKADEQPPVLETIAADQVAVLMETYQAVWNAKAEEQRKPLENALKLKLGSMGVSGSSPGQAFAKLTSSQAAEVDGWLSEQTEAP